jgi:hypothetical protein
VMITRAFGPIFVFAVLIATAWWIWPMLLRYFLGGGFGTMTLAALDIRSKLRFDEEYRADVPGLWLGLRVDD